MSEIKVKISAGTNVGLVRKNNEDNFVVCPDLSAPTWTIPQSSDALALGCFGALLVVADGMGGANAGEVASAIAIETVQQEFEKAKLIDIVEKEDEILKFLETVIKTADLNIVEAAKGHDERSGMGTTIVMAWLIGQKAYVAWCGDSRCYVFNPNTGYARLSKDHSYVQELVDAGKLTEEQAFDHPMSNVITRCLGDSERRARPESRAYDMRNGDVILLCSDGLCGLCHDNEIMEVITNNGTDDLPGLKDALIQAALEADGHDNVTVALGLIEGIEEIEATPTNELSATATHTRKHNGWKWVLCILALIAIAILGMKYLVPDTYNACLAYLVQTWQQLFGQ